MSQVGLGRSPQLSISSTKDSTKRKPRITFPTVSTADDTRTDGADADNKKPASESARTISKPKVQSAESKHAADASTQQQAAEDTREVVKKAKSEEETKNQRTGAIAETAKGSKQKATASPQPKEKVPNNSDKARKGEASSSAKTSEERAAEIAKIVARRRVLEKQAHEQIIARREAQRLASQVHIETRL